MKRMATVITGAAFLVMTIAGTALAQTEAPPPTTVVKGNGGGTAFTGGNVTTRPRALRGPPPVCQPGVTANERGNNVRGAPRISGALLRSRP